MIIYYQTRNIEDAHKIDCLSTRFQLIFELMNLDHFKYQKNRRNFSCQFTVY